jgi:hypothetical protein
MIVALLAATLLLADSTTAAPPADAAAAAQPAKKKADDPNALVCRSEPVLGSRMPVKKCRTAAQAAQEKLDAQADLQKAQGGMANNPH